MERKKTISKHYFDDEIKGVMDDGTIVLKQGVRRTPKINFSTESEDNFISYNYWVAYRDKVDKIKRINEEDNEWD